MVVEVSFCQTAEQRRADLNLKFGLHMSSVLYASSLSDSVGVGRRLLMELRGPHVHPASLEHRPLQDHGTRSLLPGTFLKVSPSETEPGSGFE